MFARGLNANITKIFFTFPREAFRAFHRRRGKKVVATNGNLLKQFSSATLSIMGITGAAAKNNVKMATCKRRQKIAIMALTMCSEDERCKSGGEKLKR